MNRRGRKEKAGDDQGYAAETIHRSEGVHEGGNLVGTECAGVVGEKIGGAKVEFYVRAEEARCVSLSL